MEQENKNIKVIITGGGTGGHVFPAISIADTLKYKNHAVELLFVGADNRLETTAVPKAGYDFVGLPIRGLQRKLSLGIFDTLIRLLKSIRMAKKIIRDFKPDIIVGVGGYASAAVMYAANKRNIPTLIQEQNSFPGITNKRLAQKSSAICVAYQGMEKFFPKDRIRITGNPVRNLKTETSKNDAIKFFGLQPDKKTIFVTGGSLGARTINKSIIGYIDKIANTDVELIWQTGKTYFEEVENIYKEKGEPQNIHITKFVDRMDLAYKAADLVIARAGAITISELAILGKPAIFVPSPNVAEDHQTKNAEALVKIHAAEMIKDAEAKEKLMEFAMTLIDQNEKLNELSDNILKYAKPDAAFEITKIIKNIVLKK